MTDPKCPESTSYNDVAEFPTELFKEWQLEHGAILIHVLCSVYAFYVMFIVCNEYLVPAIESLCEVLNLPSHVAGASFLAASSSIPELCVNVIGTFLTKNDLGIGTVLGSGYFNLLVIVALTAFGLSILGTTTGASYNKIQPWALFRDSLVYAISLIALAIIVWDQKVYWYESLILILLYVLYIIGLIYNNTLELLALRTVHFFSNLVKRSKKVGVNEKTPILGQMETIAEEIPNLPEEENGEEQEQRSETSSEKDSRTIKEHDKEDRDLILKALEIESQAFEIEGIWVHLLPPKKSEEPNANCNYCFDWLHYIIMLPARILMTFTIPDCRSNTNRHYFPLTLTMSVGWMGSLSYLASWMLTRFGNTLGLPDSIIGVFLSVGASFPEVLSSFIVARKGLGTMGLSNPIGSNTFDILICLGFPWFLQSLTKSSTYKYVPIYSSGIIITIFLLILSLIMLYSILLINKLILDLKVGVLALIIYIVMILFVCLVEMNLFYNTTSTGTDSKICQQSSSIK